MRFHALACDYDATVEALDWLARSSRRLILVTGRHLEELIDLFDRVVAENGGVLYRPAEQEHIPLADPLRPEFVERLKERGVEPLAVGAAARGGVLDAIRDPG